MHSGPVLSAKLLCFVRTHPCPMERVASHAVACASSSDLTFTSTLCVLQCCPASWAHPSALAAVKGWPMPQQGRPPALKFTPWMCMATQGHRGVTPSLSVPSCKGTQGQPLAAFRAQLRTWVRACTEQLTLPLQLAVMESVSLLLMVGFVPVRLLTYPGISFAHLPMFLLRL